MNSENELNLSLEIARRQNAESIELRSVTALARLRIQAGDLEDAGHLLRPVYQTFGEGFDTPDLKEAKALLDELV